MGYVFRPKDFGRDNRKAIEKAVRDFSPDTNMNANPSGEDLEWSSTNIFRKYR